MAIIYGIMHSHAPLYKKITIAIAVAILTLFIIISRLFQVDKLFQVPALFVLLPIAYVIMLFVAFDGLGSLIAQSCPFIISVATGLSASTIILTFLSMGHAYNAYSVSVFFLIGIWLFAYKHLANPKSQSRLPPKYFDRALITLFCALAAFILVIKTYYPVLNIYDDYGAYMPFMKKLAYSSTLGAEPFSERRLVSSLDAYYYIASPYLYFLPAQFARLFDTVFGGICLLLLAFRFAGVGLGALFTVAFLFYLQPDCNALPYYLKIFFLLALAFAAFQENLPRNLNLLIATALIAIFAFCERSSAIPVVTFILATSLIYHLLATPSAYKKTLTSYLLMGAILFFGVLLFSSLHYLQVGTFLFPVLGLGGHGSQYSDYFNPSAPVYSSGWKGLKEFLIYAKGELLAWREFKQILTLSILSIFYLSYLRKWSPVLMHIGCLIGIAIFLHSIGTGSGAFERYAQPLLLVQLGIAFYSLQTYCNFALKLHANRILLVVAVFAGAKHLKPYFIQARDFINFNSLPDGQNAKRLEDDFSSPAIKEAYAELDEHIPKDSKTIVRVTYPFLLNLTPNQLLMDLPGGASPKPGIPYSEGADAVADYFIQNGVHYLAWDYQRRSFYDENSFQCDVEHCAPWIASSIRYIHRTAAIFDELKKTRKILYQKNGIAVIDLNQASP